MVPRKMKTQKTPYDSVLYRDVPKTKIPINSPEFDNDKCWHCQEFPRIIRDPDVIIWCERCYILMHTKFDGTIVEHKGIPALKKLLEDKNEGKRKCNGETKK